MNDIVFLNVQRIIKILLITIQPFLISAILYLIFPSIDIFRYLSYIFLIIVGNELFVLFLSVKAALTIKGKEYLNSNFYKEFQKEYTDLTNNQKALYYYSRIIEKRLKITAIYNKTYDDHFYFDRNNKEYYSVMVKDYFGVISSDTKSQVWNIKYKSKNLEVNNPFHLNKRIMDGVHLSDYETIENIVIISERTKLEMKHEGIFYLGSFLYKKMK